mmetsp:Transcript_7639/g.20326  ORF Transcript_7639/g.20326 Transcript_7639/m.20326 type:complete len:290 (-) Transcript_7639:1087-1956(-)
MPSHTGTSVGSMERHWSKHHCARAPWSCAAYSRPRAAQVVARLGLSCSALAMHISAWPRARWHSALCHCWPEVHDAAVASTAASAPASAHSQSEAAYIFRPPCTMRKALLRSCCWWIRWWLWLGDVAGVCSASMWCRRACWCRLMATSPQSKPWVGSKRSACAYACPAAFTRAKRAPRAAMMPSTVAGHPGTSGAGAAECAAGCGRVAEAPRLGVAGDEGRWASCCCALSSALRSWVRGVMVECCSCTSPSIFQPACRLPCANVHLFAWDAAVSKCKDAMPVAPMLACL